MLFYGEGRWTYPTPLRCCGWRLTVCRESRYFIPRPARGLALGRIIGIYDFDGVCIYKQRYKQHSSCR